ncbi:MAG: YggS family pyridoxal phosphate-dependent enzyme [Bacteroidota bacterium]
MEIKASNFKTIQSQLEQTNTLLVAVSKTKPNEAILELYEQGHLDFGENRVQEVIGKAESLPKDINWHYIGHLQTNKVKNIASFVYLIHSVDSFKILKEINKQAVRQERVIDCLLQFKIAAEDTKYGFDLDTALEMLASSEYKELKNIRIIGVMGMATFTEDMQQVRSEFSLLKSIFDQLKASHFTENDDFKEVSMGMSGDYDIAIEEGSTMVRIGSLIFGAR